MSYHHLKGVRPKPKMEKFSPFKVSFSTPKVSNGLLDTECSSVFECVLDFPFRVFLSSPHTQTCFHPQSMIFFISFMDNSGFFRNNYRVDKCPKINLDKVQIIHNFIVIQSSLLFLCMHLYLNTNYQPITKLFN